MDVATDRVSAMDFLLFSVGLPLLLGVLIQQSWSSGDESGGADGADPGAEAATLVHGDGTAETIVGTEGDDVLLGYGADDRLSGLGGSDTIFGGTGADVMNGGPGNDALHGNEGADMVSGGLGHDSLMGGSGADTLLGNEGNDTLVGGPGQDRLFGGAGNDLVTIWPETDGDYVQLDEGADTLDASLAQVGVLAHGGADGDLLVGGAGADSLTGDAGADVLIGGAGADSLTGGVGNDVLDGSTADGAADVLSGGDGDDTLRGGAGDALTGGDGMDRFVLQVGTPELFGAEGAVLRVEDFLIGADRVEITHDGAEIALTLTDVEGGVVVSADGVDLIFLAGLRAEDLGPGDFLLVPLGA